MASVLKHTMCPACGHRHHFCLLADDLQPGQDFDYLCPETAKNSRLRPTAPAEIFRFPPQGAVVLQRAAQVPPQAAAVAAEEDGTTRLQNVLPEVNDLANKVGGLDQLGDLVETLKESKE
jgi:hypothetical protein